MNYEAKRLYPLYRKLNKQKPLPNGTKELLAAIATFDMNKVTGLVVFNSRQSNEKYLKQELDWYISESLVPPEDVKVWQQIKSREGLVNSNYGYLIFNKNNHYQFNNVLDTLLNDKYSRQAVMIYTRPSLHYDWCKDGMRDFICTYYQHFFIRNDTLHCITNMRSNDCIFGTMNDIPWFEYVYNLLYNHLIYDYHSLKKGTLKFIANSFHCYERHYDVLKKIAARK